MVPDKRKKKKYPHDEKSFYDPVSDKYYSKCSDSRIESLIRPKIINTREYQALERIEPVKIINDESETIITSAWVFISELENTIDIKFANRIDALFLNDNGDCFTLLTTIFRGETLKLRYEICTDNQEVYGVPITLGISATHPRVAPQKIELEVLTEQNKCVVCGTSLSKLLLTCSCGTRYHMRCAMAIVNNLNSCWICGVAIDDSKPGLPYEDDEITEDAISLFLELQSYI